MAFENLVNKPFFKSIYLGMGFSLGILCTAATIGLGFLFLMPPLDLDSVGRTVDQTGHLIETTDRQIDHLGKSAGHVLEEIGAEAAHTTKAYGLIAEELSAFLHTLHGDYKQVSFIFKRVVGSNYSSFVGLVLGISFVGLSMEDVRGFLSAKLLPAGVANSLKKIHKPTCFAGLCLLFLSIGGLLSKPL